MARLVTTLRMELPWWWRAALRTFAFYHIARAKLGAEIDVEAESERIAGFIIRHTKFTAE